MTTTTITLDTITDPAPPPGPHDWNDDGVVIRKAFFDDGLLIPYEEEWRDAHGWTWPAARPGGWPDTCPYMRHDALRRLCCDGPLAQLLEGLIGEPAAVNLNLTGWVSTQRDWHADQYLNEPEVGDHYAAVWIALGDINADSGPFQYVPGSHRWPQVTRAHIARFYDIGDPQWPKHSEDLLTPLFAREIAEREADIVTHLPQRGDLLVWHGRLLHRGSVPAVPGTYRPALIAHYSGVNHRPRMPTPVQHEAGGFFFPIVTDQPV